MFKATLKIQEAHVLTLEVVSQSVGENSLQITAVVQIRFKQTTAAEGDYRGLKHGPLNI